MKYHYNVLYRKDSSKRVDLRETVECFGECNISKDQYGRYTLEIQDERIQSICTLVIENILFGPPTLFEGMFLNIVGHRVTIQKLSAPLSYYKQAAAFAESLRTRQELKILESKAYAGIADLHFLCM